MHVAMSKPFYFIFAVSIMFIMTCHAASNSSTATPTICPPSDCGNGIPIKYPFWKRSDVNAADGGFCGYQEFGLNCSTDGKPIIKLLTNSYFVTDIDYVNNSITLLDINVLGNDCPRAKHNVSLGSYPLSFSQLDQNITFYFNCSFSPSTISPIPCLNGINSAGKKSYVFEAGAENVGYDWQRNCDPEIVVTVKKDEIQSAGLIDGFGVAMNRGFVLDWRRAVNCAECELSGGYCGFNETTKVSICMCEDGRIVTESCHKGHTSKWKTKLGIGATGVGVAIAVLLTICCFKCKSSRWPTHSSWFSTTGDQDIEAFLKNHGALTLKRYKFSDVKKMTNSFKVKLGQGGFGAVYKGKLLNGSNVAVKVLTRSKGNGEEFINEVASISRTSHVNVVTLLGFCIEGHNKVLIYEFMSNGSLDKFIYNKGQQKISSLSWDSLYQIVIEIARGLEYLHRGCSTRILHLDIKPHNILLDENFCPKISDFGLAKLCPRKESIISMSDARGTIGYVAPEVWNRHFGGVSHKSDVYSYGMMLLEIVGGRKNINAEASHTSEIYFPDWIYRKLEQGTDLGVDEVVAVEENEVIKKITMVGLWCIQTFPNDRPTMSRVVEMLVGNMNSLEMPPKPVLSSPVRSVVESSTTTAN